MAILSCLAACDQAPPAPSAQQIEGLTKAQKWDDVVRLLGALPVRSADQDFAYATALAHLDRLTEAEHALHAGERLAPADARFPTELAGIAFKQKRYAQAARLLRRAEKLAPADRYVNDFLATVYFLEGNTEAAVKYWNRVGKPHITEVRAEPTPHLDPALLDRAFAFSPAATLQLAQLLDSEGRLRGLGVFPQFQLDLRARSDGSFDVDFRSQELNGFGNTKLEALTQFFRELPFQGVTPEYDNAWHEAINLRSLLRWDAQKRRVWADVSGPFEHSAKFRYDLSADLRNENWAIRNGFEGPALVLASLNLRREAGGFALASFASDRLRWKVGGEFSHRDYRKLAPGTILMPQILASGFQIRQLAELSGTIVRIPERRFTLDAEASSEAARLWSSPNTETSEKLQGSLGWHWLPRAKGDDYEMQERVRAGKTLGQVPFDELFILGLERDNDLPLRVHIGTRDGRKGSAPLGRNYFLHSFDADKSVYGNGLMTVKVGPLLDIGKITDPGTALGSRKWLFDTGVQLKVRVFATTVAFSYGKDLRTGNNAFYATLVQ